MWFTINLFCKISGSSYNSEIHLRQSLPVQCKGKDIHTHLEKHPQLLLAQFSQVTVGYPLISQVENVNHKILITDG